MSTIIKNRGEGDTYATCTVTEVADYIRRGTYRYERNTPRIRFAADYRKLKGEVVMERYCGLVALKISNLRGEEEVGQVMRQVVRIPHTHLAWRSDDRRSICLVCRLAWQEEEAPCTAEQQLVCQRNGYKLLHYLYSTQLALNIDTEDPTLDLETEYSYDPDIYLNEGSMPIYVSTEDVDVPKTKVPVKPQELQLLPGMDELQTRSFIYHNCFKKAMVEGRKSGVSEQEEDREIRSCELLARYCYESGLPIGYALSHTRIMTVSQKVGPMLELIFQNAYAKDLLKDINFRHVDKAALLTYQTEAFLNAFYRLRRNVLTGEVQYRERSAYEYDYRPLTEQVLNSMTIRALKAGLGSWDKDVKRLINSKDIEQFDPLAEYLFKLPKWDGKDRVAELAARIPSDSCPRLPYYLHVWLLSMVAHWLGKDRLHGNAIVPLLIGDQGCGKTTFASIILPRELRDYYNDKVDFRSDSDLMMGLSRFALINIDEFDSLKKSQQPTLKYLLSKGEVKFRPAYGKTIEQRRRYASFIATTNLSHPLVDRTGSRRFVCIQVSKGNLIDTQTPINYDQLYAQLMAEINQNMRYWFDDAETQEIQQHNAAYVLASNLSEMIDAVLLQPKNENEGEWHSIDEIIERIADKFKSLTVTNTTHRDIGKLLKAKGYEHKKTNTGAVYNVMFK